MEFIGKKIVGVIPLPKKVIELEGWDNGYSRNAEYATALLLDDGSILYPSQDEEGNGPGCIFGTDKDMETSFYFCAP